MTKKKDVQNIVDMANEISKILDNKKHIDIFITLAIVFVDVIAEHPNPDEGIERFINMVNEARKVKE